MMLSLLVVDDIPAIAEGFAVKFRRVSQEQFHVTAVVKVFSSSDDVISYLADETMPDVDLIFTDIDLQGSNDKSGVAIARYAKAARPDIPRVGCSGKFFDNELSADDKSVFDKWWPKAGLRRDLASIADDVIQRAMKHRNMKQTQRASPTPMHGAALVTPQTHEEFKVEGFVQRAIEPSASNGIVEPFAIWVRSGSDGFEIEVVGCPALFSCGDTYEEAESALIENIEDYSQNTPELSTSFTSRTLKAKAFAQTVTGNR